MSERIAAAAADTPPAVFIDLVGSGYVELALALAADRIDTIVDFNAIARYGVEGEGEGSDPGPARRGDGGRATSSCRSSARTRLP